jgi:hypothetical protein
MGIGLLLQVTRHQVRKFRLHGFLAVIVSLFGGKTLAASKLAPEVIAAAGCLGPPNTSLSANPMI